MFKQSLNQLCKFFIVNPEYNLTTEVIGQSYEGRDLRIAKICRGGCGNKPAMYIQGGIHVCFVSHNSCLCISARNNSGKVFHIRLNYFMAGSRMDVTCCCDLLHKGVDRE